MKHLLTTIGLTALLTMSATTMADHDRYYSAKGTDKAKVTHVEPVYRYVRVATPHQECWTEPRRGHNSGYQSYTGTIAGGIIGGVVGNQFGSGSGKTAMTVAGTLLGGSVGRDMTHRNQYQSDYRETCRVVDRYREERHIDHYRVTYRYKGQLYSTEMDHHPGKHIPVNVHVTPARRYY